MLSQKPVMTTLVKNVPTLTKYCVLLPCRKDAFFCLYQTCVLLALNNVNSAHIFRYLSFRLILILLPHQVLGYPPHFTTNILCEFLRHRVTKFFTSSAAHFNVLCSTHLHIRGMNVKSTLACFALTKSYGFWGLELSSCRHPRGDAIQEKLLLGQFLLFISHHGFTAKNSWNFSSTVARI